MKKGTVILLLIVCCLVFLSNGWAQEKDIKIRISSILVRTENEAKEILQKLNAGEDFSKLADLHSIDPGSGDGGDLGYFSPGELIEELNAVALNLKVGQNSSVIKTSSGYFIIMKTDEITAVELEKKQKIEANWIDLVDQVEQLYQQGKYKDAIPLAKEALNIAQTTYGPDDIHTGTSLNNIGTIYGSLGQYENALLYLEEALKIRKKLKIPKDVAQSLNNIGAVYIYLGQQENALLYLEEALKTLKGLDIPKDKAYSLNNIGEVYRALGQYEKALLYFEEALKIRKELNIPKDIAASLNSIGEIYRALGKYKKALKYYEDALNIEKQHMSFTNSIAISLNNIGLIYAAFEQYEKSFLYFENALMIQRELKIPQDIATSLNNIGEVYRVLSQYEKALLYFEEALKIRRGLNIPQDIASSLNIIGLIYESQGQYKKALLYYEETLKIARKLKIPQNIAASLVSIGKVYLSIGKYEKALLYHEDSMKINEKLKIPQGIATSLNDIGLAYHSLGHYEKALSYYEKSLKISKENNLSPRSIAANLNNIGQVYSALGQYEKALAYGEKALKINKELKIPQDIAKNLTNICVVYSALGQYEKALAYGEKALKINRELKIPQDIAGNLNNIGVVYSALDQKTKAILYHEEAMKIAKELKIPKIIAYSLNNISSIYIDLGQNEKALLYLEEALKINRELKIPQDTAKTLSNIGLARQSFGQYKMALLYYEEALRIFRELKIPRNIADSLNDIGVIYNYYGHYEKSLSYHEEALKIIRELKIPRNIAVCLNEIGGVYYRIGKYEEALSYHEEALKITREFKIPRDIAGSLNNIGLVYDSLGQYEKALLHFEEALKISRKLKIPKYIVGSLFNIGGVYLCQKRYKLAEENFIKAEKEEKKTDVKWGGNPGLVDIYLANGMYQKALNILKEIKPKWNDVAPRRIQFHTQNGFALKGNMMLKEASHNFLKAFSITEEMRNRLKERAGFLEGGSVGGRIHSYKGLVSTLTERAINGEKKDKLFASYGRDLASNAFYFSESTKARVLLESMAESERQKRRMALPESLQKKEQNFLNKFSAIESQWEEAYKKGEKAFNELQDRKKKLSDELNTLIKELRETYPKYAALYYPKPIPPEELPLKNNEVLIEYAIGDDAGYVFVVRKGGIKKLIKIPVGIETLEEKVKSFMEPLNTNQSQDFSVNKAKELYDILLSKVLKEVKEEDKIIIIPDGILGLLPFDALVIKPGTSVKDSLYVGDKYNLSYYQSATVMAFQRRFKGQKAEKVLFALGNPVFNKEDPRYAAYKQGKPLPTLRAQDINQYAYRSLATRREWGKTLKVDKEGKELSYIPLPETETEVKSIARIFGIKPVPPDVLLNIQANETVFRKVELDKYRYIHFATHADLPGRVQGVQEPFLLLGQVENQGKDDGFLTMSEVLGLKLNADLVVLSACVTGVGKHMEGEGVVNFARAFQYAGAESVIVSLWEVSSDAAVEYMKLLYGHLKSGNGKAEALRLARKEIKVRYPNPFYWAVFILHGEG